MSRLHGPAWCFGFPIAIALTIFTNVSTLHAASATAIIPSSAPSGARVIVTGSGLDGADLRIVFSSQSPDGASATIVLRTPMLLELTVPSSAISGPVRVFQGSSPIAELNFNISDATPFVRVGAFPAAGTGKDSLKEPSDVVVLPSGMMLVSGRKNHQVRAFHLDGRVAWVAGSGAAGFSDGPGASAKFHSPAGIAVDSARNLIYVADEENHRIRSIRPDGTVSTFSGSGKPGLRDGPASVAQFKSPRALALDDSGNLYVADRANHAIRKIAPDGSVTTVAGAGTPGFSNGPSLSAKFHEPSGIAINASGAIFVSDTQNHSIRMILGGQVTTIAGTGRPGPLKQPGGLALDEAGDLLIADSFNHSIRKLQLNQSSLVLLNISGTGIPGFADGGPTTALYKFPEGVTSNGPAFVADTGNDAIRIIYQSLGLSALYPESAVPGETIRLFGTGFVPGATEVRFGALRADVTWVTSTELLVEVPAGVTGSMDLVISTPAGTAVLVFSVSPVLVALAIDPSPGTLQTGQAIQLNAIATYSNGASADLTSDAFWTSSLATVASVERGLLRALSPGVTTIGASHGSISGSITVTVTPAESLPPDPASVAPPLDPSVPTTTYHSTRFLYEGPDPIQTNVMTGAIEPERAMVVRGRLIARNGQALSGVRVSLRGKPELGETLSRADGKFDFVANGGGTQVLRLQKDGYLPADRQITSDWGEDIHTGDIALVELDATVTPIRSNESAMQVARGGVTSDADGTRRATLLFPPATEASMILPSGASQPMSSLAIRATEYTVGDTGKAAMPAALPPQSGYTYCVELSADEAVAAGATSVQFSRPVIVYVENFLGFPVGGAVPAGYYDRTDAAWVPLDDGRVVKILGVELGHAYLDVHGDGLAADNAALSALGITDEERATLAQLYGEGQSLWRTRVSHFSPLDLNWPSGPPPGAEPPLMPPPNTDTHIDRPDIRCGSIIDCQNQALGEAFSIDGSPLSIHYRSDRMPGRRSAFTVDIPLSGAVLPPFVQSIFLEMRVAGREYTGIFAPSPDQRYEFTWDGRDAYGRKAQGRQQLDVRIGYVYPAVFQRPADPPQSFGAISGFALAQSGRAGDAVTLWQDHSLFVGTLETEALGLGGWSAGLVHHYDPQTRTLYLGNGEQRSATASGNVIAPFAGTEIAGYSGDGGPALDARLGQPHGLAVAEDGTVFIADGLVIRKVAPDGTITTVAGNGIAGFSGDGGPATEARLFGPEGVAVAPDGSIYIADSLNHRVRKVSPDGTISTFAGSAVRGFAGDGGPATSASLRDPSGVAIGPDGSVYIADEDNHRVRRVSTSGIISTVAGTGERGLEGDVGDGGPAIQSKLHFPEKVVVGRDGSIYIASVGPGRIRRIGPDGIITTVAGDGTWDNLGLEGVPATSVSLDYPNDLAVDGDGNIFIAEPNSRKVFQVRADGVIVRIAGDGRNADAGDYGPPRKAAIRNVSTLGLSPNGDLFVAATSSARVRKVSRTFPGLDAGEIFVPSGTGGEVYVFDADLRHVRTVNSLTKVVMFRFGYDGAGRLITVTDVDGEVTRIERDSAGMPTAILGPRGHRTQLDFSPSGLLSRITDPSGDLRQFTYDSGGLLLTYSNPNQKQFRFRYDGDGRLTRQEDPAGGSKSFTRAGSSTDFTVTLTSAEGRTTLFDVEELPSGQTQLHNTGPGGLTTASLAEPGGARTVTSPAGMTLVESMVGDTRFGLEAPLQGFTLSTPGGRTMRVERERETVLLDPSNPLSVDSMSDYTIINGRYHGLEYYASTNQFYAFTKEARFAELFLDGKGRPARSVASEIHDVSYDWDSLGQLTTITQSDRITRLSWKTTGELDSITDPLQRTVRFMYDDAGRVIAQVLPDSREIRFTYDANGNLTSLTPPSRPPHAFTFTDVDLNESYTPPPETATGLNLTRYVWNRDRDLMQVLRPDGATIDFAYDDGGRLEAIMSPTDTTSVSYNATTGLVEGVSTSAGESIAYMYDGVLPLSTTWTGSVNGSVGWSWDNDFRVTSETAGGVGIAFGYDGDGLVTSAGPMSLEYHYGNAQLLRTTTGSVTDRWTYDLFGETSRFTTTSNNTPVIDTEYVRDAVGRITTKRETVGSTTVTLGYGFDTAGRLTTVTRDGTLVSTYTYDGNGNRLSHITASTTSSGTYDTQDRMTAWGDATYVYTPNGELQQKSEATDVTSYEYDGLGNFRRATLPSSTTIEYVIDAEGRRVGRKVNGVLVQGFLYAGALQIVSELDGTGAAVSRFVYARGANVPDLMIRNAATYRIIADHLGSVRLVIDIATGAIAQQMEYDDFGNVVLDTNPGFQPFGFAGGLYDRDTNLVRFGARDYDPATGRFISKDPIGFAGGDANLYGYVMSDPVNLIDPTGLDWTETAASLSAGFGDVLLLGLGDELRDWTDETFGWNGGASVNECSGAYSTGEWAGMLASALAGGSAGWRAAGSKAMGKEFSHWIPDRLAKRAGPEIRKGVGRSRFNGNYVTPAQHYRHDPYRYPRGWRDLGPRYSPFARQVDRVPRVGYGAAAGGAAGASGRSGAGCGC